MKESRTTNRLPKTVMNEDIDTLVDIFIAKVNAGYREPIAIDIYETPPSVLVGEPDEYSYCDWMIKPFANEDWVEPLEQKLGHRFPIAYRSLITRYIFPGFEAGDIFFFGNTPEGTDYFELRKRIFCDPGLCKALLPGGFIQFGEPETVNYDPICFDMNRGSGGDCPIVQIDHEGILCAGQIDIVRHIAPSFRELLDTFVNDK